MSFFMVVASTFATTVFLVQMTTVNGGQIRYPEITKAHDYSGESSEGSGSSSFYPEDFEAPVEPMSAWPPVPPPPPLIQYLLVNVPEENDGK